MHPPTDAPGEAPYDERELAALRVAVAAGKPPVCPRDAAVMVRRSIGGGSFGLGYARRREWLICPTCKRSAIFDVARGTRT